MGHIYILLHIFALAAGLWSAFSVRTKFRILRTEFLRHYFIFILLFLAVVFLRMSSRYIFTNLPGETLVNQPLFILLVSPLRIVIEAGMAFSFLKTLWALQGRTLPVALQRFLAGIFALYVSIFGFETAAFMRTSVSMRLTAVIKIFDASVLLAVLAPLVIIIWNRKKLNGQPAGKTVTAFSSLYLAGFILLPVFIWLPSPFNTLLISLVYIFINFLPEIWLRFFFPLYRGESRAEGETSEDLGFLSLRYGITDREKEIIHLIMLGKSNKEIEKKLFISHHTVRNHIHNVYEKMNVKSRGQLQYRIQRELDR